MTINYRRWTTLQIATLRELAELKFPASVIGERVGATRNAVIGQCARSQIQLQGWTYHRGLGRHNYRRSVAPRCVAPRLEAPPLVLPDPSKAVAFRNLKKYHCREVISARENGLAMFCGTPKSRHYSYCAFHAAKNFRPETESQVR